MRRNTTRPRIQASAGEFIIVAVSAFRDRKTGHLQPVPVEISVKPQALADYLVSKAAQRNAGKAAALFGSVKLRVLGK